MTTHIISTRILWCGIVEPHLSTFPESANKFGCCVLADDVPDELRHAVQVKFPSERVLRHTPHMDGIAYCGIYQPIAPIITLTEGFDAVDDLIRLYERAKAVNIRVDRLFDFCPARLAVDVLQTPAHAHSDKIVDRLVIRAIEIELAELRTNFRRLQRQHFDATESTDL